VQQRAGAGASGENVVFFCLDDDGLQVESLVRYLAGLLIPQIDARSRVVLA